MSTVYFISDLHLGHKNILKFAGEYRRGATVEEHDEWLVNQWNAIVHKNDLVYVLGDVAFTLDSLRNIGRMRGQKILIMGNHDKYPLEEYLKYFRTIRPSPFPYKKFWLSHCPIHPAELRGRMNVHGHVHHNTLPDKRYINVSVEPLCGLPMSLEELIKMHDKYIAASKHFNIVEDTG